MIISGWSIYGEPQVVAVNKNSNIKKLSDLSGKVIAVQASTKPEDIFLDRTNLSIPLVKDVYSLENRKLLLPLLEKVMLMP